MYNRYLEQRQTPAETSASPALPAREREARGPLPLLFGKLETGDLLLILVLLLAWLEKEDEELLILLSVLVILSL